MVVDLILSEVKTYNWGGSLNSECRPHFFQRESLYHRSLVSPPSWQSLLLPSQKKKKIEVTVPHDTFPLGQDPLALYSGLSLTKGVPKEMGVTSLMSNDASDLVDKFV